MSEAEKELEKKVDEMEANGEDSSSVKKVLAGEEKKEAPTRKPEPVQG